MTDLNGIRMLHAFYAKADRSGVRIYFSESRTVCFLLYEILLYNWHTLWGFKIFLGSKAFLIPLIISTVAGSMASIR